MEIMTKYRWGSTFWDTVYRHTFNTVTSSAGWRHKRAENYYRYLCNSEKQLVKGEASEEPSEKSCGGGGARSSARVAIFSALWKCRKWVTRWETKRRRGQKSSRCRTSHNGAVGHWPRPSSPLTSTSCGRAFINLNISWITSSFLLRTNCGSCKTI